MHSNVKQEQTTFFKSNTVANAREALANEEAKVVIRSVNDFNE
jgi:hypothetical protein